MPGSVYPRVRMVTPPKDKPAPRIVLVFLETSYWYTRVCINLGPLEINHKTWIMVNRPRTRTLANAMIKQKPLILQIQEDCLNSSIQVAQILRKAKVAATKLELSEFLKWINGELDGYVDSANELPPYREINGSPKAYNPYQGWQSIIFNDSNTAKIVSRAPIGQAIGSIEDMVSNWKYGGMSSFPYPPEIKVKIVAELTYPYTDVHIEIPKGALVDIIDKVRNALLDWTLGLEKSGILGEGMSFKNEDKLQATTITQNIRNSLVNVTGQVSDQAAVTNIQNKHCRPVDIKAVVDFANQARKAITQLPDTMQDEAQNCTEQIVEEASKKEPNHSQIQSLLTSFKAICEGAAGSLVAQGIVARIGNLL